MAGNDRAGRTRDEYRPVEPKYTYVPGTGRPGGVPSGGGGVGKTVSDLFKQAVSFAGQGIENIGQGISGAIGGIAGIGTPQGMPSAAPIVSQAAAKRAVDVPVEAVTAVSTAYDQKIWKPWSRAEAATFLTVGDELKALRDGSFYNPIDVWKRAYDAADRSNLGGISPGQAGLYALQQVGGNLPAQGVFGLINVTRYLPQVDPYDPAQREQYKSNPVLKYTTGALDFGNAIFGDPTVIGGKALKVARLATLDTKISAATGIFRTEEQAAEFAARAERQSSANLKRVEAQRVLSENQRQVAEVSAQMRAIKQQMDEISSDPAGLFDPSLEARLDDLAKQKQALEDTKTVLVDDYAKAEEAWLDVRAEAVPKAAAGPDDFVNQIFDHDMTAAQLMEHRTIRRYGSSPGKLASILEAAKKTGDRLAVMDVLQAAHGDVNAYARLNDSYAAIHEMLRRAQGDLSHTQLLVKAARDTGGDVAEALVDSTEAVSRIRAEVDNLIQLDKFLSEAVSGEGGLTAFSALQRGFARSDAIVSNIRKTAGILPDRAQTLVNRFGDAVDRIPGTVEELRVARARSSAALQAGRGVDEVLSGWSARRFQMNRLARPIVLMQWSGGAFGKELPSGWVALHGMNESEGIAEFKSWLQSVKAWDNNPQLRERYLNAFINAGQRAHGMGLSVGDVRWKMIELAERRAFIDTAASFNSGWAVKTGGKTADGLPEVAADALWEAYKSKRKKHWDFVKATRGEGKRAYGVSDDGETILMSPQFDSQLADSIPIMDIQEVRNAFRQIPHDEMSKTLDLATTILYKRFGPGKGVATADVAELSKALYTAFDRLWRPAVLLRLGYTQRNVLEGTMRSIAYLGMLSSQLAPLAVQGTKNVSLNAMNRMNVLREQIQAWNEFALLNNVPQPSVAPFALVPRKKWVESIESSLEGQSQHLALMRDWHDSMRGAYRDAAEADIATATKDISDLKALPVSKDRDVSLKAARKRLKAAQTQLAKADDDASWFSSEVIDLAQERFNQTKSIFARYSQAQAQGQKKRFIGDEMIQVGPNDVPGVYQDASGAVLRGEISSESRKSVDMNLDTTLNSDFAQLVADKWTMWNPPRFGTGRSINEISGDAGYWVNLERAIQQIRNDSVAEKILAEIPKHADISDGLRAGFESARKWLRTADGKSYFERIQKNGEFGDEVAADTVALERYNQVWRFVGADEDLIRRMASSNDRILAGELRAKLFDSEFTVPIHGEDIAYIEAAQSDKNIFTRINEGYTKVIEKFFKALGSIPEDRLVRHPLGVIAYKRYMQDALERFDASGQPVTQELMDELVRNGRQMALREVRSTLYTVMRKKKAGQSIVAVSPFVQAQQNSLATWAKLLYENPAAFGVGQQAWRNLDKLGTVEQDPDTGETYLTMQLPDALIAGVAKVSPAMAEALKTYSKWSFNKSGFNLIMPGLRGDDVTTQAIQTFGIGPIIQVPVGMWIKANPDIDETLQDKFGIVFPAREILSKFIPDSQLPREGNLLTAFGMQLAPAWSRNLIASSNGQDNYRFAETVLTIARNKLMRQDAGTDKAKSVSQILKEAEHEATMFMFVRTMANLTLPVVPRYETALKPYIQQLRALQDQYGQQEGFKKFIDEHPDMWYANSSLTSNPSGVDSTTLSVNMAKKHSGLMDKVSSDYGQKYLSLITDTVEVGQFDIAANLWKRNSGFVQRKDAAGALNDSQIATGWLKFHQIKEKYASVAAAKGLESVDQNPLLSARQKVEIYALGETFPKWAKEREDIATGAWKDNIRALRTVAFNPDIVKDEKNYEHMDWVRRYFGMRDLIEKQLKEITRQNWVAKFGYEPSREEVVANMVTIDSQQAVRLRAVRDYYVGQLRANTMFASIYDRWLDSDKFTSVSEGTK